MKKTILLSILLIFCIDLGFAQNAKVNLWADKSSKINVYEPIDEVAQEIFATNHFDLKAYIGSVCSIDIDTGSYKTVILKNNQQKVVLVLFPGDEITVSYIGNNTLFKGTNEKGHKLYFDTVIKDGTMKIVNEIRGYLISTNDYNDFYTKVENKIIAPIMKSIDSLEQNNFITKEYANTISNSLSNYIYAETFSGLKNTHRNKSLTDIQKSQIKSNMDKLYLNKIYSLDYKETVKLYLSNSIIGIKTSVEYKKLSSKEKAELNRGYEESIFGTYNDYLLLPVSIRSFRLLSAVNVQLKYGTMGFAAMDLDKLLKYYQSELKDTEAFVSFEEIMTKEKTRRKNTPKFINTTVNSISELSKLIELKDKYLFIDLWATWCLPCLIEFEHNDTLDKLLKNYNNLEKVFISIDKEKDRAIWKSLVSERGLEGYNLIANELLINDIKTEIYKNNNISIPRYILIDPKGNIVNDNLPRPSNIEALKNVLNKSVHKMYI